MMSLNKSYDTLESGCATSSANDMIVSDDDSASLNNKAVRASRSPSTDNSSYSGSDDETVLESDQPLFLDKIPPVNKSNNGDPLLGCDVGVAVEDDAVMAKFLQDAFQQNAATFRNNKPSGEVSPEFVEDVLNSSEMDALLNSEMILPDICL